MKKHRHEALIKEWLDNGMPKVEFLTFDGVWLFVSQPHWSDDNEYRLVYPPKPKKQVKMLCWFTGIHLYWVTENAPVRDCWFRVPAEDKLIEIEE